MRRYVYKMEGTYKVNIGNKCVDATELLYCDGPLLLLIDDGDLFYKFKTLRSEKKEYWVYIKRSSNTELFLFRFFYCVPDLTFCRDDHNTSH